LFTRLARYGSVLAAHPLSSVASLALIVAWFGTELLENHRAAAFIVGAAAVLTLAVVFLLQHAHYHDTRALHAKIDELILSLEGPRDQLAGIEQRASQELAEIQEEEREERR
jgi:low affinity Fe/Cu permease